MYDRHQHTATQPGISVAPEYLNKSPDPVVSHGLRDPAVADTFQCEQAQHRVIVVPQAVEQDVRVGVLLGPRKPKGESAERLASHLDVRVVLESLTYGGDVAEYEVVTLETM